MKIINDISELEVGKHYIGKIIINNKTYYYVKECILHKDEVVLVNDKSILDIVLDQQFNDFGMLAMILASYLMSRSWEFAGPVELDGFI